MKLSNFLIVVGTALLCIGAYEIAGMSGFLIASGASLLRISTVV